MYLDRAIALLQESLESLVRSPVYETAAMEFEDQPDFLNIVVKGTTSLSPENLLAELQNIETRLDRVRQREIPKGPRTLDIDILLYGNRVLGSAEDSKRSLIVPHPAMHRRLFVLQPLLDIDPLLCDPRDSVRWSEKASQLSGQEVKLYQQ